MHGGRRGLIWATQTPVTMPRLNESAWVASALTWDVDFTSADVTAVFGQLTGINNVLRIITEVNQKIYPFHCILSFPTSYKNLMKSSNNYNLFVYLLKIQFLLYELCFLFKSKLKKVKRIMLKEVFRVFRFELLRWLIIFSLQKVKIGLPERRIKSLINVSTHFKCNNALVLHSCSK